MQLGLPTISPKFEQTVANLIFNLTNRFHVAMRLFSNRSQMTSKCGKNKKVAHQAIAECVTDVLTTFWHPLWSSTEQMHGNMESICFIQYKNNETDRVFFLKCVMKLMIDWSQLYTYLKENSPDRVWNCAGDQNFTTGHQRAINYAISRHDNYTNNSFDFQPNWSK